MNKLIMENKNTEYFAQQLINLAAYGVDDMAGYEEKSFIRHLVKKTGFSESVVKAVLNSYWKIPHSKRMFMKHSDWIKWLSSYNIVERIAPLFENKGKREAERLVAKLRSGLFKKLSDVELQAFRSYIALALDLKESLLMREGRWNKLMKSIRAGSQRGPWVIMALDGKRVIYQEKVDARDAIPAHYVYIKKKFSNKTIAIEDGDNQIVYIEKR